MNAPAVRSHGDQPMLRRVALVLAVVVLLLVTVSCGEDDSAAGPTPTPAAPTATLVPTPLPTPTVEPTPTEPAPTPTPGLEQPAVWPAADVVFSTPEEAATDFVTSVLGFAPRLGEFQAGDSRSGEIELLAPSETDTTGQPPMARSLLLLRQLGPSDGWFVLAAISDVTTITEPESGATVAAGPVEVAGDGMGFEATVVVEAFEVGTTTPLDRVPVIAGEMGVRGPYRTTLDLSGATPGSTVVVIARGGVGLETDPGDLSAIPLVIAR